MRTCGVYVVLLSNFSSQVKNIKGVVEDSTKIILEKMQKHFTKIGKWLVNNVNRTTESEEQ